MAPLAQRLLPLPLSPRAPLSTRRQTLAFAVLLVLLVLLTLTGLLALALQFRTAPAERDREAAQLTHALQARGAAARMAAAGRAYLSSWDPDYRAQHEAARRETRQALERLTHEPGDAQARDLAQQAAAAFEHYARRAAPLLHYLDRSMAESGVTDPRQEWRSEVLPAHDDLLRRLGALIGHWQGRFEATRAQQEQLDRTAALLSWAFLALLVASAAFAVWTYRAALRGSRESQQAALEALEALRRSEEELREALAQNEFVQHAARIGVWRWDPARRQMWWSESLNRQLGYTPGELAPSLEALTALLHPEDREPLLQAMQGAPVSPDGSTAPPREHTFRLRRRDGSWQWCLARSQRYAPPREPQRQMLIGVQIDITALHEAHERLAAEREAALVTLHSIGEGLIVTDPRGAVEQMNQSACAMTGWREAEARGRPVAEVFRLVDEGSGQPLPDPVGAVLRDPAGAAQRPAQVARLLARDGREIPVEESVAPVAIGGERRGAVLVFRDVSEARRLVRDMAWEASHDALTGLLNRREFDRRLVRVLEQRDDKKQHALLYFDLDRFKIVNDSCGHPAGDELLRQLARLVEARLRERDSLARMGGDEFAVLLEHCALAPARAVAENILAALRDWRFVCEGRAFQVGASIGIVPFRSGLHGAEELLRRADHAAYAAKQAGRDRIVVHGPGEALIEQRKRDADVIHRLGDALREDRFELHAQPIVAVDAARAGGEHCEILLRLRHEDGSLLPPSSFLPVAERYDLMPALDRLVVDKALRQLARMPERLARLELCTVNLSARTLGDPGYAAHVERLLRETGVPAAKLCFEITETAAIADLPRAQDFIARLRALGCRFALDDFGTGMASFAYLKQLPVDYIKIDGSFVVTLADSAIDLSMVRAINDISHEMGRLTIAEFVPDEATLAVLRRIGIDFAQGFSLGRPEPLERVLH